MLLSQQYDALADSDIILIYNVLNEITSNPPSYPKMAWRNLEYMLKVCDKRVLVLLMEPSAKYTRPRVDPIVGRLMRVAKSVVGPTEEEFIFNNKPLKIKYENYDDGLNVKLFRNPIDGHKPTFETSLKRIHLACVRDPLSPISKFNAERQFRRIARQRDERQRFKKPREQTDFFQIDSGFGTQKVTKKYLDEP